MPSWLLITLQFALIAGLIFTTRPEAPDWLLSVALLITGGALGLWAISANRWGNFNIRPELKSGARLITSGPYRWIRHPIYTAILVGMAAFLAADWDVARGAMYGALWVVLCLKANREEQNLRAAFGDYDAYAARTQRFIPMVW